MRCVNLQGTYREAPSEIRESCYMISEILLHDSRIFATRFQETFPVIHEKAGKKKILLIFQLPYNQYPFRIFRHPETVIATLSYQPYNPVC